MAPAPNVAAAAICWRPCPRPASAWPSCGPPSGTRGHRRPATGSGASAGGSCAGAEPGRPDPHPQARPATRPGRNRRTRVHTTWASRPGEASATYQPSMASFTGSTLLPVGVAVGVLGDQAALPVAHHHLGGAGDARRDRQDGLPRRVVEVDELRGLRPGPEDAHLAPDHVAAAGAARRGGSRRSTWPIGVMRSSPARVRRSPALVPSGWATRIDRSFHMRERSGRRGRPGCTAMNPGPPSARAHQRGQHGDDRGQHDAGDDGHAAVDDEADGAARG